MRSFIVLATLLGSLATSVSYGQTPAQQSPPATANPFGSARPLTTRPQPAPQRAQQPSGPGQVWVNASSKVYHCPGDRYYGKTKRGEFMPEAQAKSSGFHGVNNKACT